MTNWYVVNVVPHQERRAVFNLERQGYHPWLPLMRRTRRHARKVEDVTVPLFPGYLFVAFDPAVQPWSAINGTFGVRRLICANGMPTPVPSRFIDGLRSVADSDGVVSVADSVPPVGSLVEVTSGAFAGSIGTLTRLGDKDRVEILLTVMGREVTATTTRFNIEPVAAKM